MKRQLPCYLLFTLLAGFSTATSAEVLQMNAGVTCQPATSADAAKLDYREGNAFNIHSPPGTAAQNAAVVCALPPVPPGHLMTRATIYFYDFDQRWSRCSFYNLFPGIAPRRIMTTSPSSQPHIGRASMIVDATEFVPHAVHCVVRPGQRLYAVETAYEPWP